MRVKMRANALHYSDLLVGLPTHESQIYINDGESYILEESPPPSDWLSWC